MEISRTRHRKKIMVLAIGMFCCLAGLIVRVGYLMIFQSQYYSKAAEDLQQREREIKAARGRIVDATGTVLAENSSVCTISVIHNQIREPERVIEVLTKELGLPEEKVRKFLFSKGFRYRKNDKKLPGCPDIVLPKYKTVIFVNGCFWHKHNCKRFVWPASNEEYWKKKILRNVERDKTNITELKELGWKVLVVWECELKKDKIEETLENLKQKLYNI